MIKCRSDEIIINYDSTVWPCCWTLTNKHQSSELRNAEKDWNSLIKHDLETILSHELFTKHFNNEHWNDELRCDNICKKWCTIKDE